MIASKPPTRNPATREHDVISSVIAAPSASGRQYLTITEMSSVRTKRQLIEEAIRSRTPMPSTNDRASRFWTRRTECFEVGAISARALSSIGLSDALITAGYRRRRPGAAYGAHGHSGAAIQGKLRHFPVGASTPIHFFLIAASLPD